MFLDGYGEDVMDDYGCEHVWSFSCFYRGFEEGIVLVLEFFVVVDYSFFFWIRVVEF